MFFVDRKQNIIEIVEQRKVVMTQSDQMIEFNENARYSFETQSHISNNFY